MSKPALYPEADTISIVHGCFLHKETRADSVPLARQAETCDSHGELSPNMAKNNFHLNEILLLTSTPSTTEIYSVQLRDTEPNFIKIV